MELFVLAQIQSLLKKFSKKKSLCQVRLKGDSAGDQKRVSGPKEAFSNGATSIVVGRSITKNNITY